MVSTDCIDVPNDKRDRNGCSHVNFNTGVLHFRPTEASKQFLQTWKTKAGVDRSSISFTLHRHRHHHRHRHRRTVNPPFISTDTVSSSFSHTTNV